MGSGIIVGCKNCDYYKQFLIGIGFSYWSLENVIYSVHYSRRKEILEIINKREIMYSDNLSRNPYFERRLFECRKCHNLIERLYVKIEYDNDKIYETIFNCSKCRSVMTHIENENDVTDRPCPKCKDKSLEIRGIVNWD